MRIGIDIDEVIVEFLDSFLEFYNSKHNKNFKKEDFKSYIFEETLGGTHEDSVNLIKEFSYSEDPKLVEDALEVINQLAKGHELIVLTARHPMFKEKTTHLLKKHFGDIFLEILYTGEAFEKQGVTKADLCKNLGVNFIIEDNKLFSFECAQKGIRFFLLDKPWNQNHEEHENIIRVNNWREILDNLTQVVGVKNE